MVPATSSRFDAPLDKQTDASMSAKQRMHIYVALYIETLPYALQQKHVSFLLACTKREVQQQTQLKKAALVEAKPT